MDYDAIGNLASSMLSQGAQAANFYQPDITDAANQDVMARIEDGIYQGNSQLPSLANSQIETMVDSN